MFKRDCVDHRACKEKMDAQQLLFQTQFKDVAEKTGQAKQSADLLRNKDNEFRGQLDDQASTFLSKDMFYQFQGTYTTGHDKHEERLQELEKVNAKMEGKASKGQAVVAMAFALFAAFMSVVGVVLIIVLR